MLAACLVALVVAGLGYAALARPAPGTVPVVVATAPVALGEELTSGVVAVRHLPAPALPQGALGDLTTVLGRRAAGPLVPGEVLTPVDVHAARLLDGLPADVGATFLPLPEPGVLAAVTEGDHVDVHSPVAGDLVAGRLLVLGVRSGEDGGVWLAVPPEEAKALAAARGADPMGAGLLITLRQAP